MLASVNNLREILIQGENTNDLKGGTDHVSDDHARKSTLLAYKLVECGSWL